MSTRATLAGLAIVAAAILALHFLGSDSARETCELRQSASTCAYALR